MDKYLSHDGHCLRGAGLALIFGIDRFMSEARALTNTIGNCVATIVISRWEKKLDLELVQQELKKQIAD